jgi:hypothetical protein
MIFQLCEATIKAEPTINCDYPAGTAFSLGMKQIDPVKYSKEPKTETRKLRLSVK